MPWFWNNDGFFRQKARDCMLNRAWAEQLQLKEVNKTWEELIAGKIKAFKRQGKDWTMQDVYQAIIDSSQTSRPGVDHMYEL